MSELHVINADLAKFVINNSVNGNNHVWPFLFWAFLSLRQICGHLSSASCSIKKVIIETM